MKSSSLVVLACLFSAPVFSQSLPDEINYAPYETKYQSLKKETSRLEVKLGESRATLLETRTFIREMTEHIAGLQNDIRNNEQEIYNLQREIPELERQIRDLQVEDGRVQQDLRYRQGEESRLITRYNQAQNELRPLEQMLARKEQRLRDLETELNVYRRQERDEGNRLAALQTEASRQDSQIQELRNDIRKFQEELRTIDARIQNVQSQISSLQMQINQQTANLNTERSKLAALNAKVAEYESELTRLRAGNAPAAEIQAAARKVAAAKNNRDSMARSVGSIEAGIVRTQGQIRTLQSQIEDIRRSQTTIPSRIQNAESKLRQIEMQRARTHNEINRQAMEVQTARRNVQIREQQVMVQANDVRSDLQVVQRQRQYVESMGRDLQIIQSEVSSLIQRSRSLNQEIARAFERTRSNEQRIPVLQKEIRTAQSEIMKGETELRDARTDERSLVDLVAKDETAFKDSAAKRDTAQAEMTKRISLYNVYLSEAEKLGESQAQNGLLLGAKEGERLATVLSKQNGSSVGREMGLLQARYWGSVRGEIDGYDKGLAAGLSSLEDISRATSEAYVRASQDAELYAQKNIKPVYFEEFVLEEFKKPQTQKIIKKSLAQISVKELSLVFRGESVTPVTPDEIARSQDLVTALDSSIIQLVKDISKTKDKVTRLSDPAVTFISPVQIPFGQASCEKVYKGVPVFKASCEGAYKGAFSNNYLNAARDSYENSYTDLFHRSYEDSIVSERERSYATEFTQAQKIGEAEGLKIGKDQIYASTFEKAYKSSYVTEIGKSKIKAKNDASTELREFLKGNPLLTVSGMSLSADNFRGGEEVIVSGKVKNVGEVPLRGPVLVKITSLENAEVVTGEGVLTSASTGMSDLPSLKIKVSRSARAGDKVVVKGIVDLPGDVYKTSRQEKFELVQTLSANPASVLNLEYNKTPAIKGTFRRYIHFLSVKISPEMEELKEGYELTLTPSVDAAALIELKESRNSTGPATPGSMKEIRFSYVFKDQAKGKILNLELSVSYQGKVIRKETISFKPQ